MQSELCIVSVKVMRVVPESKILFWVRDIQICIRIFVSSIYMSLGPSPLLGNTLCWRTG